MKNLKRVVISFVILSAVLGMWQCARVSQRWGREHAAERQQKLAKSVEISGGTFHRAIWQHGELLAPEKTVTCETYPGSRGVIYKDFGNYYVVEYLHPAGKMGGDCTDESMILVPKDQVKR
jgi:hypothetical protein